MAKSTLPKKKKKKGPARKQAREQPPKKPDSFPAEHLSPVEVRWRVAAALLTIAPFVWAYWPTILKLVDTWESQPDYSHGYLVIPIACALVWSRWDMRPLVSPKIEWSGLVLIAGSIVIRLTGGLLFLSSFDGWSILLCVAGVVWLFFGWRVLLWSAAPIAFLFFMVPLPYRLESSLSYPLQSIATKISVFVLQTLGQPAIAEGHTILLGDIKLEIAQACSGLRIFVGVIALACAYVIAFRRTWWERVVLMLSVAPIALIVNASRIVATGFLFQHFSDETARHWVHDASGWVMIPFAAALFGLLLVYLSFLYRPVRQVDVKSIITGAK